MLKNNKAEQLDNLFLEPNLIILIFVISHWLREKPKGQVPPKTEPRLRLGRRACALTKGCHVSQQPFPTPGSLCAQSASSSNSVSVGFKRIFCLHICTPSPFLKMDLNQDASRNEDEMSVFRGIQKNTVWGKCNNF